MLTRSVKLQLQHFMNHSIILTSIIGMLISVSVLSGCSTVHIPRYVQDESPYNKVFYHNFDDVLKASTEALIELGWIIKDTTHPSTYERTKFSKDGIRQILLITDVKENALVVGTRYGRLNIYFYSTDEQKTEVEVRYMSITSVGFNKMRNFHKDDLAKRIFERIERNLINP